MKIVKTTAAMHRLARQWKRSGTQVALVPTMGYLHEGHLSLAEGARKQVGKSGVVVLSIYVNPTQFAPTEDLSRYPRDFKRDSKLCHEAGVDVIFAPSDEEMYPGGFVDGFSTFVIEEKLSRGMEGASRPTHFRGVATVVAKLFNLVQPDLAIFGAKDFQQAAVVTKMVHDLDFPLEIIVAPTHREPDGLAMSSRNKYLNIQQRKEAVALSQTIQLARELVQHKPVNAAALKEKLIRFIGTHKEARLDYIELFDSKTLSPVKVVRKGTHLALAVFYGKTRLIDNGTL